MLFGEAGAIDAKLGGGTRVEAGAADRLVATGAEAVATVVDPGEGFVEHGELPGGLFLEAGEPRPLRGDGRAFRVVFVVGLAVAGDPDFDEGLLGVCPMLLEICALLFEDSAEVLQRRLAQP